MTENINIMKDISNIADELSRLYKLSNNITEEQINKDSIGDLGFTFKTFNDFENLGSKISSIMKLKSILTSLGVSEKTIAQGIKFASNLINIANNGKKSLDSNNNKTLKDIGLDSNMFGDISKAAKMFDNLSKSENFLENINSKSDLNLNSIVSGLNKILRK